MSIVYNYIYVVGGIDDDWPGLTSYLSSLGHTIVDNVTMGTVDVLSWTDVAITGALDQQRSTETNSLVNPFNPVV